MKRLLRYDKRIYLVWLASLVSGFEVLGIFMIPFFKDWAGLNQLQIQSLQSWFMFAVFLLEIPTGLIGDIKGRKYSVLLGYFFLILGPVVYGSYPHILIFIVGELLFAIGKAFFSGAHESLVYDICKETNSEDDYSKIWVTNSNLKFIGMMSTGLIAGFLVKNFELNQLVQLTAVVHAMSFIIILFVKEPKYRSEKELIPDYKEVFRSAFKNLKDNISLRRIAVYVSLIYWTSYFVLWFYQVVLLNIGIKLENFGLFRILLLVGELILGFVLASILDKSKSKRMWSVISALLVASGFMVVAFFENVPGVVAFIIISGGIGMNIRNVFSKSINIHIKSENRSTTLSAISMIRTLTLAGLNPLIGWLSDLNLTVTFLILGGILILTAVFLAPREEDFDLVLSD
jgi:MFS family permease